MTIRLGGGNLPAMPAGTITLDQFSLPTDAIGDRTTMIQRAFTAADGGVLVNGTPGRTYVIGGTIEMPGDILIDMHGATLKPTGVHEMFKRSPVVSEAVADVTGGATLGSRFITVSSTVGFIVGRIVTIRNQVGGRAQPFSWRRIMSINAGTNTIEFDSPLEFDYYMGAPVPQLNQVALASRLEIRNAIIDISDMLGDPVTATSVFNLFGYEVVHIENVHFIGSEIGLNPSDQIGSQILTVLSRFVTVENISTREINLEQSAAVSIQAAEDARINNVFLDGNTFGTICVSCDTDSQTNIRYRGRLFRLPTDVHGISRSVRAVKSSACRQSTYMNIWGRDCETLLEIFDPGRVNAHNINGTNLGLKPYEGQTAINIAASFGSTGVMQHCQLSGIHLRNLGGHGVQLSGDFTGRIMLSNLSIQNVYGTPIVASVQNVRISGVMVEDWATGGLGLFNNAAIATSGVVSPGVTMEVEGVTAIHNTHPAYPVLDLSVGPQYDVRGVKSPTLNPIYSATQDLGAQNVMVGSVAAVLRSPTNLARVSQVGKGERFTLPQGKTITITFDPWSVEFQIGASTGGAGKFWAEQTSATVAIDHDLSALFVNSAAPAAGKIGVSKAAAARVISIKNNFGGDLDFTLFTMGGRITAISDPA